MCGRFAQPRSSEDLARLFGARAASDLPGERYNVAPTDEVAAVLERHDERILDTFRWGLVPTYAESATGAARLINARSETVETSPAFRTAFARRRCIIPADAFYEWHRTAGKRSEPYAIRRWDDAPLALAGLWSIWSDPETAKRLYTCTIVTTVPNALIEPIHNRMPVILDPADWDLWLGETTAAVDLRKLLRPFPENELAIYPVSMAVNNVRSEGPELLEPLE